MRWRLSITSSSGRIRLLDSAWRNSATDLPVNSTGAVAAPAALRAGLRAFCWRPRACPPFFAARLRDDNELVLRADVDFFAELFRAELFLAPPFFSAMSVILPRSRPGLSQVERRDDHRVIRQPHARCAADRHLAPLDRQLVRRLAHAGAA